MNCFCPSCGDCYAIAISHHAGRSKNICVVFEICPWGRLRISRAQTCYVRIGFLRRGLSSFRVCTRPDSANEWVVDASGCSSKIRCEIQAREKIKAGVPIGEKPEPFSVPGESRCLLCSARGHVNARFRINQTRVRMRCVVGFHHLCPLTPARACRFALSIAVHGRSRLADSFAAGRHDRASTRNSIRVTRKS